MLYGGELIEDVTTHPKTRASPSRSPTTTTSTSRPSIRISSPSSTPAEPTGHALVAPARQGGVAPPQVLRVLVPPLSRAASSPGRRRDELRDVRAIDDPEPWEANSSRARPRPALEHPSASGPRVKRDDLSISPMFLDVQYDRGRDDALAETPMLAILEHNDVGIIVRGWKAIGTASRSSTNCSSATSGALVRRPSRRSTPLFPCNTGRLHLPRESRAQPDADPYDRPLAPDRRRARRHGLLRRRPHPLGPGPAPRQPPPR